MTKSTITCFVPMGQAKDLQNVVNELAGSPVIEKIYITGDEKDAGNISIPGKASFAQTQGLTDTTTIKKLAASVNTDYVLIYTKAQPLKLGAFAMERMLQVAENTTVGMVYADHFQEKDGALVPLPVIDYQDGSLRDDFNFGSLLLYRADAVKKAAASMQEAYKFAGLYDLRLKVSQEHKLFRLPEFLYTEKETDTRKSGEKIFDYVDPKNREVQVEMEKACTQHLKDIGAWLKPAFSDVKFTEKEFPVEASVIIPVRNRIKTIEDAVGSVLTQKTPFAFNCIIVNNHSTDGTTEVLEKMARENDRIIHVIPERKDLGIGGCWNEGVFHDKCGQFAIQLDSDDLYIDDHVIKKIVEAFYSQNCAMVVGSYQMVNFKLESIPPGLIDHKEWTPENGRNNALRINGLGAPRAFYTPVIREFRVPNVSYGEDYALALNISRHYQIGRIYEPLYLCRRWDDNTDASLDVKKMNEHNTYKDRIRTIELYARMRLNQS